MAGGSNMMLVGASENIVISMTVSSEALESDDRNIYLVNTLLSLRSQNKAHDVSV